MVHLHVKKNTYYDSVTLMLISQEIKKLGGVEEALVGMGTELNKEIAGGIGLNSPELSALCGNDFFVAVKCDEGRAEAAVAKAEELLNQKKRSAFSDYRPATLDSALKLAPELNMAVISVPGAHAAKVARDCLERDINVMMFSDNVSVEDERALKELAVKKELLMMGPDCGTAIVNGVPLAFANQVRRGDIGIVAASGTGAQEVSCVIDRLGGGVSQLLATGGRDLKAEVGGLMFAQELDALINDDSTKVILLVSKPPAKEVQTKILKQAQNAGKPVVVCFIGGDTKEIAQMGLVPALSLEDAARKATALSKGEAAADFEGFDMDGGELERLVARETSAYPHGRKFLRGLFTGGTLCDEAMKLLTPELGGIYSNIPLSPEYMLGDVSESREHTCLDFGDDTFTVGRPHPMIDPFMRDERLLLEAQDPETAVILLDCVIGYGAHPDPAASLAEAVTKAKAGDGKTISFVASVCGTEADPQCLSRSREILHKAGVTVMASNAQAARLALCMLKTAKQGGNAL